MTFVSVIPSSVMFHNECVTSIDSDTYCGKEIVGLEGRKAVYSQNQGILVNRFKLHMRVSRWRRLTPLIIRM
jgi:hypothetical protein